MSLASSTFHWDAFEPIPQERVKKFFDTWLRYLENDPAHRIPMMLLPRQSGKLSPPAPWRVQLARIVRREMGIKEPELGKLPLSYITLGSGDIDVILPGWKNEVNVTLSETKSNRASILFDPIPFIIKEKKS